MGRKKIFITLLMAVVLIMNGCFGTLEAKAQEVTTVGSLEEFDVADFNQWKSGLYAHLTGMYRMNSNYVCVNEYKTYTSGNTFTAVLPDQFHYIVRELDGDFSFIRSVSINNGYAYTPATNAKYIAIIVSSNDGSKYTFQEFERLFEENTFDFIPSYTIEELSECESTFQLHIKDNGQNSSLSDYDMSNQAEWQTGYYSYQNLEHIFNTNMLCLKSYLSVQQGTNYQVDLPESIELTIREIDANGIVIRSVTKLNGSTYIPSEKASYVALSMSGEKEKLLREELIAIISEGQFRMVGSDVVADEIIYEITLEEPSVTPEPLIAEKSDATIIENCDFSELSNWQSGYYTFADANLAAHASRIAFVDYKRFISGNTYEAVLPENRTFVIRELAADYSLVKSVNLTNGATYKPSLKTVYLAVSVIVTDNTKTTFAAYEEYILNNEIQLVPSETLQEWQKLSDGKVIINQNDISILDNMSISSMDQWKSGAYNKELGTYEKDSNSICLKDLKKFSSSSTYQASVPEGFKLQVLELDEDNEVLRVVNLFDGADYMPRSDAASLAITIVTADGSKCSYSNYTALLECSTVSLIKE